MFFKGCLPQIFVGPFLDALSHLNVSQKLNFCCGLLPKRSFSFHKTLASSNKKRKTQNQIEQLLVFLFIQTKDF